MGGLGSGRWYRWDSRDTVEGNRRIDVRQLQREGCLRPGLWFSWAWWDRETGEQTAYINIRTRPGLVELSYRYRRNGGEWQDVEELIQLTWTPCSYGGQRAWFVCPGVVNDVHCRRRVAVLYGAGAYFLCRHCYRLGYASQRENRADRALRRASKIRERLADHRGTAWPFPPKPRRMRWKTYERLQQEAEDAEYESLLEMDRWIRGLELHRPCRSPK